MEHPAFISRSTLSEVMSFTPEIVREFINLGVNCAGCSINKFCTLEDVCRNYHLDLPKVILILEELIRIHSNDHLSH